MANYLQTNERLIMELRELITKTHGLREQLKRMQKDELELISQIETFETEIKTKLDQTGEDYENLTEDEFQLLMADLSNRTKLAIEVVYVNGDEQFVKEVQLSHGATIEDGIIMSELLDKCPEINLSKNKIGIHGLIKPISQKLEDGDRIEIYRPVRAKTE